jgi:soluble lytic murein transglycosylase-like protein
MGEWIIIPAGILAALALLWPRRATGMVAAGASGGGGSVNVAWTPPDAAAPYLSAIRAAEMRHAMPKNLLARLLYQESRFRSDIISGAVVSSAGAVGIAQIIPRWHPGVNPLDPFASIDYAASYLASLRHRFGAWELALAAYNWGPTALAQALRADDVVQVLEVSAPAETRAYVSEITRDVLVPGRVYV